MQGLTGCRLKAAELVYAGIATHYIPSARLPDLERDIISNCVEDPAKSRKIIKGILKEYSDSKGIEASDNILSKNESAIT
jgi:3-hydroxyisobutyryl-CoA hydrolase